MFDDDEDDYPDYFLGDDEDQGDEGRTGEHHTDEGRTAEPRTGRMIVFGNEAPRQASADEDDNDERDAADEREDNDAPLRGCLSGWFLAVVFLGIVVLAAIGYFRYLSPVVDDARATVNVVSVERRGVFFKTYEAEIVDPGQLADTSGVYTHPRSVSLSDASVAAKMREAQQQHRPCEVRYEVYSATLPWRGESKMVITDATPL